MNQFAPLRILIADDNKELLHLLGHLVQMMGHQLVGVASNGLECIRQVDVLQPDLVILDITMPGLDGFETARQIKKMANVPILISTGAADDKTFERMKQIDIAGYLSKPFSFTELEEALNRMIRRKIEPEFAHANA